MARYYEETALIEFVNLYTPTINGETTMKCVERAIRSAPTADVVPTSELDRVMQEKTTLECIIGTARNLAKTDTVKKMRHELITRVGSYKDKGDTACFGLFYRIITETTEELLSKDEREGEG